jgi:hypothetical protein
MLVRVLIVRVPYLQQGDLHLRFPDPRSMSAWSTWKCTFLFIRAASSRSAVLERRGFAIEPRSSSEVSVGRSGVVDSDELDDAGGG